MALRSLCFKGLFKVTQTGFKVKAAPVVLCCGLVMWVMLASNVLLSCAHIFDCRLFWPTISYIGCYQGHDLIYAAALTFYTVVILLVTPVILLRVHASVGLVHRAVLWLGGVLIALALPWLALFDEASESHLFAIKYIHLGVIIGVLVVGGIWVCFSLRALQKSSLRASFLWSYLLFGLSLLICNAYQRQHTETAGLAWANENLVAAIEWSVVTVGVFLPYVYVRTLGVSWIEIKAKHS